MPRPELTETEYLRQIERLARGVANATTDEDWFSYDEDPPEATRLQRMAGALARGIRRYHFDGDGCMEDERDRPEMKLAGVLILRPEAMPVGMDETYEQTCLRLGVDAQPEGWALWNTWSEGGDAVTMVVSAVATTEGLLTNWTRGIAYYPTVPLPSQIVLVRQGWTEPMTLSPNSVRRLGLRGQA